MSNSEPVSSAAAGVALVGLMLTIVSFAYLALGQHEYALVTFGLLVLLTMFGWGSYIFATVDLTSEFNDP